MRFEIDKQTIYDLELFERSRGEKSIFSLFNNAKTIGGRECLQSMFSLPFTDKQLIAERLSIIEYFTEKTFELDLDKENLDYIEFYLNRPNRPVTFTIIGSLAKKLFSRKDINEQFIIKRGIRILTSVLTEVFEFTRKYEEYNKCEFIAKSIGSIKCLIEDSTLKHILDYSGRSRFSHFEYSRLDYYFRTAEFNNIRKLLDIVYQFDAYRSISATCQKNGFTLPRITAEAKIFEIQGLFHPFLDNPVDNDFVFFREKNVCFLTGPNMAGKSTFLKSLGICLYLSHIGFPVPAKSMVTSVFDGLLTTINLSDNINKGYSHFYSEVMRVKYVSEKMSINRNIFVVFDELFRGTNVKDAFDASLAVINAFAKLKKGYFVISTHIIEVANKLNQESVFFKYFEANLINGSPQYNYKIKDGVTDERIGMYILKKEKVIETIENVINEQQAKHNIQNVLFDIKNENYLWLLFQIGS